MEVDDIQLRVEPPFPLFESLDARKYYCSEMNWLLFGDFIISSESSNSLLKCPDQTNTYFENLVKRHDFADPIPVVIWDYDHEWIPDTTIQEAHCAKEALSLHADKPNLLALMIDNEKVPYLSFHLFYRSGPAQQLLPSFKFPISEWRAEQERQEEEERLAEEARRLNGSTLRPGF